MQVGDLERKNLSEVWATGDHVPRQKKEYSGFGYITPPQTQKWTWAARKDDVEPGDREDSGVMVEAGQGVRPALGELLDEQACITPLKSQVIERVGKPHIVDTSPSANKAVPILPMGASPSKSLTLSPMVRRVGDGNERFQHMGPIQARAILPIFESSRGYMDNRDAENTIESDFRDGRFAFSFGKWMHGVGKEGISTCRKDRLSLSPSQEQNKATEQLCVRGRSNQSLVCREQNDTGSSPRAPQLGNNYLAKQTGDVALSTAKGDAETEFGDEWGEAYAPDGRVYYFNKRTQLSCWTVPPPTIHVPKEGNTPRAEVLSMVPRKGVVTTEILRENEIRSHEEHGSSHMASTMAQRVEIVPAILTEKVSVVRGSGRKACGHRGGIEVAMGINHARTQALNKSDGMGKSVDSSRGQVCALSPRGKTRAPVRSRTVAALNRSREMRKCMDSTRSKTISRASPLSSVHSSDAEEHNYPQTTETFSFVVRKSSNKDHVDVVTGSMATDGLNSRAGRAISGRNNAAVDADDYTKTTGNAPDLRGGLHADGGGGELLGDSKREVMTPASVGTASTTRNITSDAAAHSYRRGTCDPTHRMVNGHDVESRRAQAQVAISAYLASDEQDAERTAVDMEAYLFQRRPIGPVQRSKDDFEHPPPSFSEKHTPSTARATPATEVGPWRRAPGGERGYRSEHGDDDDECDNGDGDCVVAGGAGSTLFRHRVRRQLFSEDSEAKPLVFCPFCGEGILKSGGLKCHLEECYVFQRCRGSATHAEVITAIRGALEDLHVVPSPLPSSRPANLVVSPPGEDSTHVTLTGDALDISVLNPINVQPFEIPVTRGGDAAGYHVAIGLPMSDVVTGPAERCDVPYQDAKISDESLSPLPHVERCEDCGRTFAPGRLQAHAKACRSVFLERRQPYDAKAMRTKGTRLEFHQTPRPSAPTPPSSVKSKAETCSPTRGSGSMAGSHRRTGNGDTSRARSPGDYRGISRDRRTARESCKLPHSGSPDSRPRVSVQGRTKCAFCFKEVARARLSAHMLACAKVRKSRHERATIRPPSLNNQQQKRLSMPERKPAPVGQVFLASHTEARGDTELSKGASTIDQRPISRVHCPHCNRGFSASSAPVHIAICARVENRPGAPNKGATARQASGHVSRPTPSH